MSTSKRKRASSTSAGEKYYEFTIAEKLDVLHDMDAKISYRKLAEKYNVSLGSLSKIAKNRDKIENETADSANLQLKRSRRVGKYTDINSYVLEFFRRARARNLPMTGPMLQEKANFYSECTYILRQL